MSTAHLRKGLQSHSQRLLKALISLRYMHCETCALLAWGVYSPEFSCEGTQVLCALPFWSYSTWPQHSLVSFRKTWDVTKFGKLSRWYWSNILPCQGFLLLVSPLCGLPNPAWTCEGLRRGQPSVQLDGSYSEMDQPFSRMLGDGHELRRLPWTLWPAPYIRTTWR